MIFQILNYLLTTECDAVEYTKYFLSNLGREEVNEEFKVSSQVCW